MDTRNIAEVFVPKNCTRTSGSDTIDTVAVTGVQIWAKTEDDGTAAETYFGPGELVVTDVAGKVLTTATALKSVNEIQFHFRSFDGKHKYASKPLRGKDITGYTIVPYKPAQECIVEIKTITAVNDTVYTIRIELEPSTDRLHLAHPITEVIQFRSALTGATANQIATGLVAEINKYFNSNVGEIIKLKAYVNTATTGLVIEALPNEWDIEKAKYSKTFFKTAINFTATTVSNLNAVAAVTINALPVNPATKGIGTYEQVAEMEWFAQGYKGYNRDMLAHSRYRTTVPLSAQEFKADGVTPMGYDMLNINWEYTNNHTLTGTDQRGTIILALPIENNATSQVGVATVGVVPILDKYIVTEYGVSSAQASKLTT